MKSLKVHKLDRDYDAVCGAKERWFFVGGRTRCLNGSSDWRRVTCGNCQRLKRRRKS